MTVTITVRWRGQLLSGLIKPARIRVCRQGRCQGDPARQPLAPQEQD